MAAVVVIWIRGVPFPTGGVSSTMTVRLVPAPCSVMPLICNVPVQMFVPGGMETVSPSCAWLTAVLTSANEPLAALTTADRTCKTPESRKLVARNTLKIFNGFIDYNSLDPMSDAKSIGQQKMSQIRTAIVGCVYGWPW